MNATYDPVEENQIEDDQPCSDKVEENQIEDDLPDSDPVENEGHYEDDSTLSKSTPSDSVENHVQEYEKLEDKASLPSDQEVKFVCNFCNECFRTEGILEKHCKSYHNISTRKAESNHDDFEIIPKNVFYNTAVTIVPPIFQILKHHINMKCYFAVKTRCL